MAQRQDDLIEKLKNALAEVRAQKSVFSDETFSQLIMALLERLRRLQTVPDVTPTPAMDEIRLVTVMFVDVKDSTTLARQMDTGDWKSLLEESHRRVADLVTKWDGMIGQYLGDGVLAFFGAQHSRGDDALRAVACAVDIQAEMDNFANDVFLQHGVEFAVRVGISTGKLVVGLVGSVGKQELLALGPATNLASRLQSEAPAGGIFIDGATYGRVRQYFDVQARPVTKLKGFDEAITAYAVLGRSKTQATHLTSTVIMDLPIPFIGRENTLDEIIAHYRMAFEHSQCESITIIGDIGMGKSRLLQEIYTHALESLYTPMLMVATYEERNTPYNLVRDWLTTFCSMNINDLPNDVEAHIRAVITSVWDDPRADDVAQVLGAMAGFGFEHNLLVQRLRQENKDDENALCAFIMPLFVSLAHTSPLFVLVDNLQWADALSINWLNALSRALARVSAVIIAGARLQYRVTHAHYMQNAIHHVITLERFNVATTRTMIEHIIGDIPRVPENLVSLVVERAEGNPLFVVEFISSLVDKGVFQKGADGTWRFNIVLYDSAFKTLPTGLIELVQARLDELSPEIRLALQHAAIVGQSFWSSIVEELTGRDPEPHLAALVARGFILRDAESQFESETQFHFRHALYRDVAYEMLPRAKRETLHRQVARWFVTRVADKPDYFGTLAAQFEAGAQHEAALFTYLEAAQNRVRRALLQEGLMLIERGLSIARNVPRDVALSVTTQLWTLQAQTLIGLGRYDEASASSQSALRLFNEMPPEQLQSVKVQATRLLGVAYTHIGNYAQADEALSQAYEWVDEENSVQMAELLRSYGMLMLYKGRLNDAMAYQLRAMDYARQTGEPHQIAGCMTHLGLIALERGDMNTALGYFENALDLNKQSENLGAQVADFRNIGSVYLSLRLYHHAFVTFDIARTLLNELGLTDNLLETFMAVAMIGMGEKEQGLKLLKSREGKPQMDIFAYQVAQTVYLFGLLASGDVATCRQVAGTFALKSQSMNPQLHAKALLALGRAKVLLNEPDGLDALKQATDLENEYGGRELGQAYLWLSEATQTTHEKENGRYKERAVQILQSIGSSLYQRPDLQYAFYQVPDVRQALNHRQFGK